MAVNTITITLTNTNSVPTVIPGSLYTTTISPAAFTTPDTPYREYLADIATITDGSVNVAGYKRNQYFLIQAGEKYTIETDDYSEALYYAGLEQEGLNVTVSPNPVAVVSVTLSDTTAAISGTGTKALSATTVPAGETVAWTSSDEAVATVSNGTVTGVAPGTCVITASIDSDGAKASATCTVTVS